VTRAVTWLVSARKRDVLGEKFLRELHRRMFDQTWRWAGTFRTTERNLGVAPEQIAPRLRDLLADTRYWIEHRTYPLDEAATRFHHRLVSIHCFANGNGRHARLITDVVLARHGLPAFTWGHSDLVRAGAARDRYLTALRGADAGDYSPLLTPVAARCGGRSPPRQRGKRKSPRHELMIGYAANPWARSTPGRPCTRSRRTTLIGTTAVCGGTQPNTIRSPPCRARRGVVELFHQHPALRRSLLLQFRRRPPTVRASASDSIAIAVDRRPRLQRLPSRSGLSG